MNNSYQCCFCNEDIESNSMDVTLLLIQTNWDKDIDKQQEQQLFCHINCLKERLSKKTFLYVSDIID